MTKRPPPSRQASSDQSPLTPQTQGLSPQRQQEQAIMLEPFYERLIGMAFDQSTTAIERCRDLCAEFGFTVKQEASTHRNIYVYCSREGLPDSLRNPKSNPQRKRPSKRCDCRWRVVLYENENHWEFRKSLNPEAGKHNHELMRPEEIERSWPKEVTTLICELARLRMTTQEIRSRVRGQFPNIHWNERRFYNRLSEERQKIKSRDSVERTQQLTHLWSKVCMATAGNNDLSEFVKQEMIMLFQSICETVQIDPQTFPTPLILKDDSSSSNNNDNNEDDAASTPASTNEYDTINNDGGNNATSSSSNKKSTATVNAPKGYLPVEIPKQVYYIKIHNQRQLHETQLLKNQRRTRTFSEDDTNNTPNPLEPARKISRKGKARQSSSSILVSSDDPDSAMQHSLSPLISQPYPNTNNNRNNSSTPTSSIPPPPRQEVQQQQQQQQQQPTTTFVYYENSSMPLDSPLSNYVHHQPFQNTYNMSSAPSTPGFSTPELTFSFDSSMGRNNGESGNNNNSNEPTIHPALQSAPMSHQQQQQQSQKSNSIHSGSGSNNTQQQQQRIYAPSTKTPPQQQQMCIIYESPKDNNSNNNLRSLMPDNSQHQQSYQQQRQQQQQQQQQQQGMYNNIRPSSPHNHHPHHPHHSANNIIPMYQQQQQQQQQRQQQQQQHPSDTMNPPPQ